MGYIKLHRSLTEWGWYDDPNTLALWIHLLLEANWKDGEWHGVEVKRGQMITSVAKLSVGANLSTKQTRVCLERLENGGEIIKEGTNKWTKITICKYDIYQGDDDSDGQANGEQTANKGQTKGNQTATIEEGNKERREEEKKTSNDVKEKSALSSLPKFVKPTVEDIAKYCSERNNGIDPEAFFAFYESKGWKVGSSPMKNWKAAMTTWEKRRREDDSLFNHQQPISTDWLVEGKHYYASAFKGHEDVLNNLGFDLVRHVKRNNGALVWKDGKFIIAK